MFNLYRTYTLMSSVHMGFLSVRLAVELYISSNIKTSGMAVVLEPLRNSDDKTINAVVK